MRCALPAYALPETVLQVKSTSKEDAAYLNTYFNFNR
jgi:hypothetical protein